MKIRYQPIKWTGSKRPFVNELFSCIERDYETYVEPFVGGGSLFLHCLSLHAFPHYIINDKNSDLISLWRSIKSSPEALVDVYERLWTEINVISSEDAQKEFYIKQRTIFNASRAPAIFLFILRTCFNGLVRYNSKDEFNSPYHFGRKGVAPSELEKSIMHYSKLMNEADVEILNVSYDEINYPANSWTFFDPPYLNSDKKTYSGNFDHAEFFKFIEAFNHDHVITLNHKITGYKHMELTSKSSFKKLSNCNETSTTEILNRK